MYPILWETSFFTIHSYGFMISLAILFSAFFLLREAPKKGYNPDHILEAVIVLGVSGLIGSRILYVLLNLRYYAADWPKIFDLRVGGLSFYGAIIFGLIALYVWCRLRRLHVLELADFFAPYLMFGYAFGRIGCFLNGCCYGKISFLPIALPAASTDNLLRHPVQLYAAVAALIFFALILSFRRYAFYKGYVLTTLLILYGILRFGTGFFRYDAVMYYGLSPAQIVSGVLTLLAVSFLLYKRQIHKQGKKEQDGE